MQIKLQAWTAAKEEEGQVANVSTCDIGGQKILCRSPREATIFFFERNPTAILRYAYYMDRYSLIYSLYIAYIIGLLLSLPTVYHGLYIWDLVPWLVNPGGFPHLHADQG